MSQHMSWSPEQAFDDQLTAVNWRPATSEPAQRRLAPITTNRSFAGRYWLEACIGQGGLATIYRATDLRSTDQRRLVALKIADAPGLTARIRMAMLEREATCLRGFNHPALPTLIGSGQDKGWPFLALPLVIGETLADALRRLAPRGLGAERSFEILLHLVDAVNHIHSLGLVHSDIKTSNILLLPDGSLKLIDFSSARWCGEAAVPNGATEKDNSESWPISALFAAPEQFDGQPADPADDVFALGVLAHILLVGRHPFNRLDSRAARRLGLPPRMPEGFPRHQWEAILQALAFSRAKRFATPADFMSRLSTPRPIDACRNALSATMRLLRKGSA
ncbi:SPS1 Serine/threonine protein kinase [Rhabdaerophilaceae bacterium]